ncbi:hypothetical protein DAI22_06g250000 [Oryza sativa Japonica Group]|nr:uncharacterized protein LOC9270111 isoform X1 [Oryza sativa Japonica Group]KAF2928051.1 hypothetical protein DAI22_06g250000 [Oryza sativa Japonica Group]
MVKQVDTSAFVILLYCASPMVAVAWQAEPLQWSLLLLLGIWLIGCFKLFGLLHIMFPAYHGDNHSMGAATPTSPACVELVNRAEVAWSGYILMAAPVLAVWAGFISGPEISFLAFLLLLLGCRFVYLAMLAPSKFKMSLQHFHGPHQKKKRKKLAKHLV